MPPFGSDGAGVGATVAVRRPRLGRDGAALGVSGAALVVPSAVASPSTARVDSTAGPGAGEVMNPGVAVTGGAATLERGLIAVEVKAGVETGAAAAISTRTTVAALVSARKAVVTETAANA